MFTRYVKIRRSRPRQYTKNRRLFTGLSGLCALFLAPYKAQAKNNLDEARLRKVQEDREVGQQRKALIANQVVLTDIKIEKAKLELQALKAKLGDPDHPFAKPMDE